MSYAVLNMFDGTQKKLGVKPSENTYRISPARVPVVFNYNDTAFSCCGKEIAPHSFMRF